MADDDVPANATKIQKELDEQSKKVEACNKQLDKLDGQFKKAMQAAKTIDEAAK